MNRKPLLKPFAILAVAVAALLGATPMTAQTVQAITASTPDLGSVASAPTGPTVFQVNPSTGAITKLSGGGSRLATTTSRAQVTIACNANACANRVLTVRVGSVGAPTGRVAGLSNFTVAMGTAVINLAPTGTNPINFRIAAMPRGATRTFWVGADVTVLGNESAAATGNARTGFYVYTAISPNVPTAGSTAGAAIARIFRPIAITAGTALNFGKIIRPRSGSGTVAVDAATGQRTVAGTGMAGLSSPAPTRATYTVSGEGGQVFSLSVPSTFQMTGPGAPITVNLTSTTANGAKTLSSALGAAGTFSFSLGGSLPLTSTTATGTYQGSYTVTTVYN